MTTPNLNSASPAMTPTREIADEQRAEAKRLICSAIGLPENISSSAIERAVDCIISAAMLEAVMVINECLRSGYPKAQK
jgi:hypothetical protein